ncbi:MAG: hypothetical protein EBR93_04375, partial [Bacteroidetes bacterium]|nr:hypothetical protein [Bacteroidota bacterium]
MRAIERLSSTRYSTQGTFTKENHGNKTTRTTNTRTMDLKNNEGHSHEGNGHHGNGHSSDAYNSKNSYNVNQENKAEQESKCPFHGGALREAAGGGPKN